MAVHCRFRFFAAVAFATSGFLAVPANAVADPICDFEGMLRFGQQQLDEDLERLQNENFERLLEQSRGGDSDAMRLLSRAYGKGLLGLQRSSELATFWLLAAANKGDLFLQCYFGHHLELDEDYQGARAWFEMAAKQGDAYAQHRLGYYYAQGLGVPRDYRKAAKWYRTAAEQGYAFGQIGLGGLYVIGFGVPRDHVQAYMWLNLALSQLSPGEERNTVKQGLHDLEVRMTTEQIAEAQRLAARWTPKSE